MNRGTAGASSPLGTPEPWNLVACGYVAENVSWLEAFAREALRLVPAVGAVLDVAAGPGSLALPAARSARLVHALDFAPAMLHELHARAAAAGITNVHLEMADGQALPFRSGSFDAAYSMFGVIFFPDRARGLAEIARVLRSGARAVVSSWPPPGRTPEFAALFEAMAAEMPESGSGEAPTPLGTPAQLTAELRAAGFHAVEVHEHEVVPGVVTPAELWRSFARGGAPAAVLRKEVGEREFDRVSSRIVARLERALGSAPRELRVTALLAVASR